MMTRRIPGLFLLAICVASSAGYAQTGMVEGNRRYFGGDSGSTKYSSLDQITADNFDRLEIVYAATLKDMRASGSVRNA